MTTMEMLSGQGDSRSTRGRTPVWRFTLDGVELENIEINSAELAFTADQHDMINVVLTSSELTTTEGLVDQPVYFVFGVSPRIEAFYGYVLAAAQNPNVTSAFQVSFLIIGATRPLQGGKPRFWRDRTIPGALRQVVQTSMLGWAGQENDFKWKTLAQTSESDWAFMVQKANRLGYRVYNRYGVVMCYDPEELFQDVGAYTRLISSDEERFNTQEERQLLDFQASETSDESPEFMGYRIGYFDGNRPQTLVQGENFYAYKFRTDLVVRNSAEAEIYREAAQNADGFDTQTATARLYGEADLYPGMSVDITTSLQQYYRGNFDGRWMIEAVTHKMDQTTFQTNLKLHRPGRALIRDLPYVSFWDLVEKAKPSMFLDTNAADEEAPQVWCSTWANRRLEGVL